MEKLMNWVLLKKIWRDLMARKGSILALVVIVSIGIGFYVSMAAVYIDLNTSRENYYKKYKLADFMISMKRAPAWAVEDLKNLWNIRSVRGRVSMGVLLDIPGKVEPVSGTAISMPEKRVPVLNDLLLKRGCWFSGTGNREVILNDDFAKANDLRPGSRIKVLLLDKQHDFLVVGTAMSPEFVSLIPEGGGFAPDPERFGVVYLPEKFLQESCDLEGAWNQVIGKVHDKSRCTLLNTLDIAEEVLEPYGVTNAIPAEDHISVKFIDDELQGVKTSVTIMPAIFLAVAVLVLNVMITRMVAQQRSVIGTMKALGYFPGAIIRHYLCYGIIIGLLGGIFGIAFGYWMQSALLGVYRDMFALPSIIPHFYPLIFLKAILISIGFSVFGTIQGIRSASHLEPAAAMRPPPPEKGGRVLIERIPFLWKPLPFRCKMIFRAIFRNPFRSSVSIFASMISTALILSALANVDSLHYLMSYEFEKVSHQDITVSLRNPKGLELSSELMRMPSISGTEPQLLIVCDFKNGALKKRSGVTGMIRNNILNTPLDKNGTPVAIPETGLILSKKLAEILYLKTGDHVRLRPLIGRRTEVIASVAGIVDTYLGLSAYADIGYLSRLLGEELSANIVLGKTCNKSEWKNLYSALKKRPAVVGISERTRSLTQMDERFGKVMGTMIFMTVFFAGLIAFGSILNTALVSLSERSREVGTLRVLGYTPAQITWIFSGESHLLNSVGIVLGLIAGIGLSKLVSAAYSTELYRFPSVIYPSRLVISAILMFFFITLAQLIIYRMITRFPWLEVLKVKE
jgi:putative ABC transport system permease protein